MFFSQLCSSYFDRIPVDGNKYYLYEEVWTEYASNFLTQVFLYAALALAAMLIGIGIFVKFKKPESFKGFFKTAGALVIGFVMTVYNVWAHLHSLDADVVCFDFRAYISKFSRINPSLSTTSL